MTPDAKWAMRGLWLAVLVGALAAPAWARLRPDEFDEQLLHEYEQQVLARGHGGAQARNHRGAQPMAIPPRTPTQPDSPAASSAPSG